MAHTRRQKENDTFAEIAQTLPTKEHAKDLDKASVLRVAINFMKLRTFIGESGEEIPETEEEEESSPTGEEQRVPEVPQEPSLTDILPNFSKDVMQAVDGFVMVFSAEGQVLYSSETIAQYLGLRQVDVIGVNVGDILHPQDCTELGSVFRTQGHDSEQVLDQNDPLRRKFLVRMRCAFTPSVRSITRCSNFKPVYCSCYLKFAQSGPRKGQFIGLVALCKLANTNKIREMVVGTFFKSKHSLDLSYKSLDRRIYWILGYDPSEMVGLRAYEYFHPEDLTATSSCHMNLLSKGESHSPCYRILSRWGDWMWVRSKSYMVYNQHNQLPEGIVIYTWVVRVDEEDDRMVAIKSGEPGEDKLKKYDPFSTEVSSSDGMLDVSSLVPLEAVEKPSAPSSIPEPLVLLPNPLQQIKRDVSPPSGVSTPPDSALCDLSSPYMANPFTLPSPPNSNSSYCGSPESHMTQGQMMGGSPDSHMTQQSPLVGDLNDSVHVQSYKLSPPYTPYAETSCMYPSPPMLTPADTPTFKYKLEHGLSPDSSLESLSLASCSYTSYQDPGASKTAIYPLDMFGELTSEQKCSSTVMYTNEQPISSTMGVTQRTVNDARLRYSGSMPTSRNGTNTEETESISQWSQWLKGTAPPPVF
uniref:Hypoxia-inducible factor 1-alpha-like protein n=1 Tax=Halichondria panicea TaxID=6063 RepID=A0A6C0SMT4_HALPA|nr:hypoxia-inducible factor 1-alpha-like protein [Halichondria panicea]